MLTTDEIHIARSSRLRGAIVASGSTAAAPNAGAAASVPTVTVNADAAAPATASVRKPRRSKPGAGRDGGVGSVVIVDPP